MATHITENELLEAVAAAGVTSPHPGPGWLSTSEVAERLHLSDTGTRRRLMRMLQANQVERMWVRLPTGGKAYYWHLLNGKGKP